MDGLKDDDDWMDLAQIRDRWIADNRARRRRELPQRLIQYRTLNAAARHSRLWDEIKDFYNYDQHLTEHTSTDNLFAVDTVLLPIDGSLIRTVGILEAIIDHDRPMKPWVAHLKMGIHDGERTAGATYWFVSEADALFVAMFV